MKPFYLLSMMFLLSLQTNAQTVALPKPVKTGGMPLMEALDKRSSAREFTEKTLSKQQLSNLLWAAWGINREGEGKRTAPSSRNKQEIDIYVCMAEGTYKFVPQSHSLELISKDDLRKYCGMQDYVATAPLNLVYVADLERAEQANLNEEPTASYANAGFISQNVYLFCASEGLGTVIRGSIDKKVANEKLNLKPSQKIILAQTVGFKKQ